jgi:hypothetical protein
MSSHVTTYQTLYWNWATLALPQPYWRCNILAQDLTGLIGYSYQQVATSFPKVHIQRTPKLSVLGLEWWGDRPGSSSRVRISEDKVRRKDLCWSVRAVYFFSGSPSPKNSKVKRAWPWPIGKFFPGAYELGQSAQKRLVLVCEDILCPRKTVRCKRARPWGGETLQAPPSYMSPARYNTSCLIFMVSSSLGYRV